MQHFHTNEMLHLNLLTDIMTKADYIEKLQLEPHPEGGYYRQIFGNDASGKKDISTIYYMLSDNEISSFHRLHGVVEIWYFHAGEELTIYQIQPDGRLDIRTLSPQSDMQIVIQPEVWFAAEIRGKKGFTLVGCAVAPAFSFDNFELADGQRLSETYPHLKVLIERMCAR